MLGRWGAVPERVAGELWSVRVLAGAGLLPLADPGAMLATAAATRRYGPLGASSVIAAHRYGDRAAIVDERGQLTFKQLDERINRLANALRERGVAPGDGVALLVRNHRGFMEATLAAGKLGARIILLNTDFAGPQIQSVADREGTELLICDEEFADRLDGFSPRLGVVRAWTDTDWPDTVDALIAAGDPSPPPPPGREAKIIILTSGTTGTPKGANRSQPKSLIPVAALFGKVPFRSREVTAVNVPLFHALGFAHGAVAVLLGTTLVLHRRFDPLATLDAIERHGITALVLVPVMLRRLLDAEGMADRDLRTLRIVFLAGSALGGELATRALDALGPVLYNLYGSTEVAAATIATPDELRAAPETVGTPPFGSKVVLYDDDGRAVREPGVTGRIFVANAIPFEGYTGGGSKDVIDGLMSTGDVGHFDAAGRLFVDGRDDDMIVSGGENLFPAEVEETLSGHPDVVEAAVVGVPDEEWGARLRAFVVVRDGATLDDDGVREHVKANLARYKVPRDVVFVDELPRNPTGKVLKRELDTA